MNLFVLLEVIKYMLYAWYCGKISYQSLNRVYKLSPSHNPTISDCFETVDKVCELQLFKCNRVSISQQKIVANVLKLVSKRSIF